MIAGFEEPTRGQILLYGADMTGVPPNKRDVNMVFRSYALFPYMTVQDKVAFGLRRKGVPRGETSRRVDEMLGSSTWPGAGSAAPATCPAASSSG